MSPSLFIKQLKKWWSRPPQKFSGGVLVNRLGWQIARVLWLNAVRRARFVRAGDAIRPYAKALYRDGVIIIPNFLPQETYEEIRKEFEKESEGVPIEPLASKYILPAGGMMRVGIGHFVPNKETRFYELLDTHLIKNEFLKNLGSTVVCEKIQTYREPQVFINKKLGDQYPDLNTNIYYHADVSYPGVKAFYYLSDTTMDNGAFTYAKGSHRLNLKRLWWDYRKSIEWAKNVKRVNNPLILGDEAGRSWHCLTREEEKREGIVGTPMVGKANSIVVFNVMGFHRQGDFLSNKRREFVMAYYRD